MMTDALTGGALIAHLLVLARLLPVTVGLAQLSAGVLPTPLAGSLALALAVGLAPELAASVQPAASPPALLLAVLRELAIGGLFALALGLALLAASWAVRLSHAPDPLRPTTPLSTAYGLVAAWLVCSLGGLRAIVVGLAESFRDAPLAGQVLDPRAFALGLVQLVADGFALTFGFALPLIVSVWLIELSCALALRLLPLAAMPSSLPLRALLTTLAAALLLIPIAGHAPEAVRTAIEGARALTRALSK